MARALRWGVAGAAIGAAIPAIVLVPWSLLRIVMPTSDGDWGEPIFYLVVIGLPLALVGAVTGAAVSLLSRARRRDV